MTKDTRTAPIRGTDPSSIALFFDDVSAKRNKLFRSNPVLDYEQQVRSRAVLAQLAANTGDVILDIGCGNARDMVPILRAGASIVGVDLSEGMIRQARLDLAAAGYHNLELEVGDATRLRFPAESFDKALCSEVIEHIPDAATAVGEMRRVLKPGGHLIVSTPNRASWYGFDRYVLWAKILRRTWNHPFDNWRNIDELCSLLEGHGFRIISSGTACYLPGFVLTYFLPTCLQRAVVRCVRTVEQLASRVAPRSGYLLVVTAEKEPRINESS